VSSCTLGVPLLLFPLFRRLRKPVAAGIHTASAHGVEPLLFVISVRQVWRGGEREKREREREKREREKSAYSVMKRRPPGRRWKKEEIEMRYGLGNCLHGDDGRLEGGGGVSRFRRQSSGVIWE